LRGLRVLLDSYPGDRMMVGEVFLLDTKLVAEYYGDNDELHLSFNFPPLFTPWEAARWRRQIEITASELDPIGAWPTWVLSNHDNKRHRTRYGGREDRARAAAVLLAGLRGSPFLYAGEELGLEDAVIPADRVVDPGGRDGCRAPIPWDGTPEHGWATTDAWLPWPPDPDTQNVDALRADPSSILHLYRRLLRCRHESPALQLGELTMIDAVPADVVAFSRTFDDDHRVVLVNFGDGPTVIEGVSGIVDIASDGVGEGEPFVGRLGPAQAVVLRGAT
jgi:alpha-glucosidase